MLSMGKDRKDAEVHLKSRFYAILHNYPKIK